MSVTFTHITNLTQSQALTWLQHNDPEGEWSGDPAADFVSAVNDNLSSFGITEQSGPIIVSNIEHDELLEQFFEAQKQAAYWKTMHDNQVARNKILRERPDLPVDRIPAYHLVEWAQGLEQFYQTHYTVLYVHDDNLQICAEHIEAQSGEEAMATLAKQQIELGSDPMLIAAVPGFHTETLSSKGNIAFAGSAAVFCSQFIENNEDAA